MIAAQSPKPIFILQAGETRFSLDTQELIRCLRAASDAGFVPPVPSGWWDTLPMDLREDAPTLDQTAVPTNRATVEALVEDTCPRHGVHAYFIAELEQGGSLPLDLPTVLQCLWFAQCQGAFMPLLADWWNMIAMDHDLSWVLNDAESD